VTQKKQLELWLKGTSRHDYESGQCCPDFSCCNPELLASETERKLFYDAYYRGDEEQKTMLLCGFLGALMAALGKNAYVAGDPANYVPEQ